MSDKILVKGSIVKVKDEISFPEYLGYYRITSIRIDRYGDAYCNLGSIFGKTIYHKRVPLKWVTECHDEWYKAWSQSETYMCM